MEKNTLITRTILMAGLLVFLQAVSAIAQNSLYQDIKANEVGDIITVVLSEDISGSSSSDATNTSNAAAGAGGSASGNFLPFKPTFGSDVEVNYDSDQRAQDSQGQLLEGYMSVRIKDQTPQGDFVIQGSRKTEINGEVHKMNLEGLVRPKDIDSRNRVFSFRVANATINYEKEGGLKSATKKRGFLKRVALAGVGIIIGAAAILKASN